MSSSRKSEDMDFFRTFDALNVDDPPLREDAVDGRWHVSDEWTMDMIIEEI